ncbi:MAG TPA: arsenic transporter [Gammaproteobacteria bacterium]|nr:arsenic transporter [Gammaproteobacteria bacterium]
MLTALLIFLGTLVLVIWRPRGLNVGWSASLGAAVALLTGVVGWQDVAAVWSIVWDATFTFVALIVISLLLDEAGFFNWAALHVARWGRGGGVRLFVLVILLDALVAALFANDGAALILTPVIIALLRAIGLKPAAMFAFVFATGFVADTTSLPLVTSNLTNIIIANYFDIGYDRYAAVMVPVDLVALGASLLAMWLWFRRDLPRRYSTVDVGSPAEAVIDPAVFRWSFPVLALLLAAYFVTARYAVPISVLTGAAALLLLAIAGRWLRGGRGAPIAVVKVLREAPWHIVVFSLGMYIVVYGLKNAGMLDYLQMAYQWLAGQGAVVASVGTGFISGVLSAVANNLPAVLMGALALDPLHPAGPTNPGAVRETMIYAHLIGCNLGPKLTPFGSLATLLWLHVLARKGIVIGWGRYMRIGLILTPAVLAVTLVGLALWMQVVG